MMQPDLGQLDTSSRLRRLFSDSVVYGLAGAVNKLLALVTFPLLARHLSVAEYGTVDVFLITANWLALVIMCGLDSGAARLLADQAGDDERAQIVSQALVWLALAGAAVLPAVWLAAEPLAQMLGQPPAAAARILPLVCLQLPLLVICGLAQGLLRWTFQRGRYLMLTLGSSAATALLLVITVNSTALKPHHVFVVALVVQAGFAALALVFLRRWLVRPRSLAYWRVLLPIALPLGVVSAVAALMPLVERSLVASVAGWGQGQAVGLYAAGAKVAGLLALPIVAFQSGWGPFIVALSREADAPRTYNAALVVYAWSIGVLVLLLTCAGPWIVDGLASERYAPGAAVIFPLALALAVQGAGWIFEAGITISKRTHLGVAAYALLFAVFVPAALVLRGTAGAAGVAYALLMAQVAFAAFIAILAQRAHPLEWHPAPALAVFGATLAAGVAHALVDHWLGPLAGTLVIGAALAALTLAAVVPGRIRSALSLLLRARSVPQLGAG